MSQGSSVRIRPESSAMGKVRALRLDGGAVIPLGSAIVTVGRDEECDIFLDSLRVSRRHCRLINDGSGVIVRDLRSTNGVRINGQRVRWGHLRPGDLLTISHLRFRVEIEPVHEVPPTGDFAPV